MTTAPSRVGCRILNVADLAQDSVLPMRLLYPTRAEARTERFGPYEMTVAIDAPLECAGGADQLPLVVISHGGRGTALTHRGLACHLARSGFAVAMPEHAGDCRGDTSRSGSAANLENRPRQVRLAIDASLADARVGARIAPGRIALIGHSMGGYTALAVAGGRPSAGPHETADGRVRELPAMRDRRVRALVVLAPACAWYWKPGSLSGVDVPVLLMIAARDEMGADLHVDYIERDCDPALIERRVVPNAGHHAFQSPFPAVLCRPDFAPSRDPEGFDRAAFQPILDETIASFLQRQL